MSSKCALKTGCVSDTALSKGSTAVKAGEVPAIEELIIQERRHAPINHPPKCMLNYSLGGKGTQPYRGREGPRTHP